MVENRSRIRPRILEWMAAYSPKVREEIRGWYLGATKQSLLSRKDCFALLRLRHQQPVAPLRTARNDIGVNAAKEKA